MPLSLATMPPNRYLDPIRQRAEGEERKLCDEIDEETRAMQVLEANEEEAKELADPLQWAADRYNLMDASALLLAAAVGEVEAREIWPFVGHRPLSEFATEGEGAAGAHSSTAVAAEFLVKHCGGFI